MQKKRHHFVPKSYLNAFCDAKGRICVYRKDKADELLHVKPDATQFRGYYYSQPIPEGGTDNNTLEDFFSTIEGPWPETVAKLQRKENINDRLEGIFAFIALQRARVPASRDATEAALAEKVKATMNDMLKSGALPPPPTGLENIVEKIKISIDPHQSIHAMGEVMQAMGPIFNKIGLAAIHNTSKQPFLTSDNPVAWFNPAIPFEQQQPYALQPSGPLLLIFPVSPTLLLMGSTEYRENFGTHGLLHSEVSDPAWVEVVNAQTCRFGYEAIIAQSPGQEDLIKEYASISPVYKHTGGYVGHHLLPLPEYIFGSRTTKPKWRTD